MTETDSRSHWNGVWTRKPDDGVSWFQAVPAPSLEMIRRCGLGPDAAVLDVGGGASRLVDHLLEAGFADVTVLDLSGAALDAARVRLGDRGDKVQWITGDVTAWRPERPYDLWHDRAAFHFLTEKADRAAYGLCVNAAVRPGGWVVIGTFAPDGPATCSGLPVKRQNAEAVGACLGPAFTLVDNLDHRHETPGGTVQRFQFGRFRKDG